MDFSVTERNTGYVFKDKNLLKKALTLSSYDNRCNNESLECLGDAILSFIVAEKYYSEGKSEGEITDRKKNLVSDTALTPLSKKLGLDRALLRGNGDDNNKKAVPSAYEALTAAIYLDGGLDAARAFVLSTLDFSGAAKETNYVGELKEYFEAKGKNPPEPRIEERDGDKPCFYALYEIDGKTFGAEAERKSIAKQRAAQLAVKYIGEKSKNGKL